MEFNSASIVDIKSFLRMMHIIMVELRKSAFWSKKIDFFFFFRKVFLKNIPVKCFLRETKIVQVIRDKMTWYLRSFDQFIEHAPTNCHKGHCVQHFEIILECFNGAKFRSRLSIFPTFVCNENGENRTILVTIHVPRNKVKRWIRKFWDPIRYVLRNKEKEDFTEIIVTHYTTEYRLY